MRKTTKSKVFLWLLRFLWPTVPWLRLDVPKDPQFDYAPEPDLTQEIRFIATGPASGIIKEWSVIQGANELKGDFNNNGLLDTEDIDALTAAVRSQEDDIDFDLNGDNSVDEFDRNIWVTDLAQTFLGDANLDGEFNSRDLVDVFVAGEYEDEIELNSSWAEGDWNGDGDFTSRDLVIAFGDGGYETGPQIVEAAVPETFFAVHIWLGIVVGLACMRKRRSALVNQTRTKQKMDNISAFRGTL